MTKYDEKKSIDAAVARVAKKEAEETGMDYEMLYWWYRTRV